MRLADDRLIRQAIRQGRRLETASFTMHRVESSKGSTQFCFRVPKKFGSAPRRNRIRRLMREFVRTHKVLWPETTAVVLSPRVGANQLTFQQVSLELQQIFVNG